MDKDTKNVSGDSLDRPLLQKEFHDLESIAANPFWEYLKRDIDTGEVFPAVRKGELQFYYGGGRILRFARKKFICNAKYLGERQEGKGSPEKAVPLDRPSDTYVLIKERCRSHWLETRSAETSGETRATAELFSAFSFARKDRTTASALIDVEVRFPGLSQGGTRQDKIDLLFRLPSGRLCFVEAKRANCEPTRQQVLDQIDRYCRQIIREPCKDIYRSVLTVWGALLQTKHQDIGEAFRKVPLLFVDPNLALRNPKQTKSWQHKALQKAPSWNIDDDLLVIDGTKTATAFAAIDEFLSDLDERWLHA